MARRDDGPWNSSLESGGLHGVRRTTLTLGESPVLNYSQALDCAGPSPHGLNARVASNAGPRAAFGTLSGYDRRVSGASNTFADVSHLEPGRGPRYQSRASTRVPSVSNLDENMEAEPLRYAGQYDRRPSLPQGSFAAHPMRGPEVRPTELAVRDQHWPETLVVNSSKQVVGVADAPYELSNNNNFFPSSRAVEGLEGQGTAPRDASLDVNHMSLDECFQAQPPSGGNDNIALAQEQALRRGAASVTPAAIAAKPQVRVEPPGPQAVGEGLLDSRKIVVPSNILDGGGVVAVPEGGDFHHVGPGKLAVVDHTNPVRKDPETSFHAGGNARIRVGRSGFPYHSHTKNLHTVISYLKNHYALDGREPERGIETMTPSDVLGLAQCFYVDAYRSVRDRRDAMGLGRLGFRDEDPNVACILEPDQFPAAEIESSRSALGHEGLYESDRRGTAPRRRYVGNSHVDVSDMNHYSSRRGYGRSRYHSRSPPLPSPSQYEVVLPLSRANLRSASANYSRTGRRRARSARSRGRSLAGRSYLPRSPPGHSGGQLRTAVPLVPGHSAPPAVPANLLDVSNNAMVGQAVQQVQPQPQEQTQPPAQEQAQPPAQSPAQDQPRPMGQPRALPPIPPIPSGAAAVAALQALVPMLRRGNNICKHVTGGKPHLRYFRVEMLPNKNSNTALSPFLVWGPSSTASGAPSKGSKNSLILHKLVAVLFLNKDTEKQFSRSFKRNKEGQILNHKGQIVLDEMCVVLRFEQRDVALTFLTVDDRDLWVRGMLMVVQRNKEQPAQTPPK